MLAWPSISCTCRRSAPPASRCVAKLWRSVCGLTDAGAPASRAYFLTNSQIRSRRRRRPRAGQEQPRRRVDDVRRGRRPFVFQIRRDGLHRAAAQRHHAAACRPCRGTGSSPRPGARRALRASTAPTHGSPWRTATRASPDRAASSGRPARAIEEPVRPGAERARRARAATASGCPAARPGCP